MKGPRIVWIDENGRTRLYGVCCLEGAAGLRSVRDFLGRCYRGHDARRAIMASVRYEEANKA